MKFQTACDMAAHIRSRPTELAHVEVLAIGRFVPLDQLATTPEQWGVSVRVEAADRPVVLWSEKDLRALCRVPVRASEESKPTIESMGVPLLF